MPTLTDLARYLYNHLPEDCQLETFVPYHNSLVSFVYWIWERHGDLVGKVHDLSNTLKEHEIRMEDQSMLTKSMQENAAKDKVSQQKQMDNTAKLLNQRMDNTDKLFNDLRKELPGMIGKIVQEKTRHLEEQVAALKKTTKEQDKELARLKKRVDDYERQSFTKADAEEFKTGFQMTIQEQARDAFKTELASVSKTIDNELRTAEALLKKYLETKTTSSFACIYDRLKKLEMTSEKLSTQLPKQDSKPENEGRMEELLEKLDSVLDNQTRITKQLSEDTDKMKKFASDMGKMKDKTDALEKMCKVLATQNENTYKMFVDFVSHHNQLKEYVKNAEENTKKRIADVQAEVSMAIANLVENEVDAFSRLMIDS
jgi:hypothetical protein